MLASIIIRTFNEAHYLGGLLHAIGEQRVEGLEREIVVVDSGSTDATLDIVREFGCRILHIGREEFSFGRSLNRGCEAARGELLVLVSGHCIPMDASWLGHLCLPLQDGAADYVYGRQLGGPGSHFSERRIFAKYFPGQSRVPQTDFYCNNANSALTRAAWERFRFDEELTGLEDMDLAKRLIGAGGRLGYVAEAAVYHLHNETWERIRHRFEREALALRTIMPEVHLRRRDFLRYLTSSIWLDSVHARRDGGLRRHLLDIVRYRFWQYLGSYNGNSEHRKLSRHMKERFFYPR